MVAVKKNLQELIDKGQGPAARSIDRLPGFAQEAIVKLLGYPYQYPQLDHFIKCLMAVQYKQGVKGFLGNGDIEKARKHMELQTQSIVNKPTHVQFVEDIRLPLQSGSIYARHYHPAPNKKLPMIVFYHGGGFVAGSVDSHDEVCRLLAVHAKAQVLSVDYPLAPETGPYTLIQSCEDALAWVYQNRRNFKILKNQIAIAGDSAGGNICAVLAQRTSKAVYAPQAQFLIYPVVDFKSRHPSFFAFNEGLVLSGSDVDIVTEQYPNAHKVALDDTIISPTYGNLKKLAPAFVVTAGHDVLHDEGKIYAYKLRQNGIKVHYHDYEDQTHGFINLTPISRKAKKYVIEMSRDFRKFWDKYN